MTLTLIVLGLTVALFILGRIRSDVVALSALAVLMVAGVLSPTEALAGFSSSVVIMMAGLFVVGGAIFQTGLARETGKRMMGLAQGNETRAFLLVMLTTSVIGAFVSNTGTVALMMPIIVSMAAQAGLSSGRMLMPLAFAGSLGGMLTLIGTPPNLVINEALIEGGYEGLSFFSFLPVGLIVIAIGVVYLLPLSKILVRKQRAKRDTEADKSLNDLVEEYQLADSLRRYYVPAGSGMVGRKVSELAVKTRHGVTILEIRNEENTALGMVRNVSQSIVTGDTVIGKGDILYLVGRKEGMEELEHEWGLERMKGATIDFYDIGIAELVLLPSSKLVGATISESRPREQYGLTVLGIRRGEEYIYDDLGEKHLHGGDVLLVQAQWEDLLALDNELDNWVVMGRPDKSISKVTLDYKAPMAALIMLLMVVVMVMGWAEPVTAVIVAALLTVLTGCFRKVDHQLGESRAHSGDDADVHGTGEDGCLGDGVGSARRRTWRGGALCTAGRYLFHDLAADYVYQQYGYCGPYGTYRFHRSAADRSQSLCLPAGRDARCEYVLRLAVLHTAQCACHEGGSLYIHGLCPHRTAAPGDHRCGHDLPPTHALWTVTGGGNH